MGTTTPRVTLYKPAETGEVIDVKTALNDNFDKLDLQAGSYVCTSTTRPGSPFSGQVIRETDTHRTLIWDASYGDWVYVSGPTTTVNDISMSAASIAPNSTSVILGPSSFNASFRGPWEFYMSTAIRGTSAASNWACNLLLEWEPVVGSGSFSVAAQSRGGNSSLATKVGLSLRAILQDVTIGTHRWRVSLQNDAASLTTITSDGVGHWSFKAPS